MENDMENVKVGDFLYVAKWIREIGTTLVSVERHFVTSLTPCGIYAQYYDRSNMYDTSDRSANREEFTPLREITFQAAGECFPRKSKWYGYNSKTMRTTPKLAIDNLKRRTQNYLFLLRDKVECCENRIKAFERGEFNFPNNLQEY